MFKSKFQERIPRTLVKAITWRIGVTVTNSVIGWIVTGDILKGLAVGLGALLVNTILYIVHERAWNRVDWDREVKE
jgi:uncharacterized membrane protein